MLTEPLHRGYYSSTHYTLSLSLYSGGTRCLPQEQIYFSIVGCLLYKQVVDVNNHFHFASLYSGGVDSIEIWFAVQ